MMNLSQRYHGPKGSLKCRQEEPPWGIQAPPGDLEESASHHKNTNNKKKEEKKKKQPVEATGGEPVKDGKASTKS